MTRFHALILEGAAKGLYEEPDIHHNQYHFNCRDIIFDPKLHMLKVFSNHKETRFYFSNEENAKAAWQYIFGEQS